ncbi:restriction endonuclease subunit S [Pantoea agglomerans]|uniref:restriction endonuclease subunit S n=1 Tax=Enterobacter agglomerans TaxID=549 RepID=UPI003FD6BA20
MSEVRWIIPKSWEWTTISRIGKVVGGGTPSSKVVENFSSNGIPWVTPADLTGYTNSYISRGRRDLSDIGYASCGATLLPIGTVLYSSRAPIGYCVIAAKELSTNQGFKNIILKKGILPEYVRYYLLSSKNYAESLASGTTFLELSGQRVGEIAIPLAPFNEQKRIVDKIESLMSHTFIAKSKLNKVPALIDNFKKTLLKNIFQKKTIEGFDEAFMRDLTISTQNGLSKRHGDNGRPINVLRLSDLSDAKFKGEFPRTIVLTDTEEEKFILRKGDLLCIRVNGSESLVGRMLTWNEKQKWAFCDHFIRFSLDLEKVVPEYIEYFFSTESVRNIIETSFVSSAGQKTVNQTMIGNIKVPLPTKKIQTEIVNHIKSAFLWLEQVKLDCTRSNAKLSVLDTMIFSEAFNGKLVKQDENDENANSLLSKMDSETISSTKNINPKNIKKNSMTSNPKARFLEDSESWPENGLPFVDIAQRITIPHDTMRDIIFSLLSEEEPILQQFFNVEKNCMYLKRKK